MRTMVLRLILFYVLAIAVMLMMTPWRELAEGGGGHHRQPIRARVRGRRDSVRRRRDEPGRHLGGDLERELEPVPDDEDAAVAGAVGLRAGVGWRRSAATACRCARVAAASAGMGAAILLAIYAPAQAFLALYGTAVAGMLFIWIVILFTYLRFRAALPAGSAVAAADQDAGASRRSLGSASWRSSASR